MSSDIANAICLDLQPQPAIPTARFLQRLIFALLGCVNAIQVVISQSNFRYVSLLMASSLFTISIAYQWIYKTRILRIQEDVVEIPGRRGKTLRWNWEDIKSITLKSYTLTIISKQGVIKKIDLGNITMQQEEETIPKITMMARRKGFEDIVSE